MNENGRLMWLDGVMEIQRLAQAGLTYGRDPYDLERYARLRGIAAEMVAHQTELPFDRVKDRFCNETGCQTPRWTPAPPYLTKAGSCLSGNGTAAGRFRADGAM